MFQFETAGPQHVAPDALPPSPLHFPPQSSCDEEGGCWAPRGVMNLEGQWVQGTDLGCLREQAYQSANQSTVKMRASPWFV